MGGGEGEGQGGRERKGGERKGGERLVKVGRNTCPD